jgi:hypothetical protein
MAFSAARLLLAVCVFALVSNACAQCDTMSLIKTNEGTVPFRYHVLGASDFSCFLFFCSDEALIYFAVGGRFVK